MTEVEKDQIIDALWDDMCSTTLFRQKLRQIVQNRAQMGYDEFLELCEGVFKVGGKAILDRCKPRPTSPAGSRVN